MTDQIEIRGARLHNLKNISLTIPKYRLVVLTGLSGSGKSSLGFDLLHKEGQRQYLESLGMVSYDLAKPPVDAIRGLSPSISVDQHLTNRSPRSTVGTATDVYTYLRVLFARLGHRPCPTCGKDIPPTFDPASLEWEYESDQEGSAPAPEETFPCPHCGAPVEPLIMAHFSFNKPEGACPTCTGLGVVHQANVKRLVDEQKSIPEGAVEGWEANYLEYSISTLKAAAAHYGFELDLSLPVKDFTPAQRDLLFYGVDSPTFRRHFPDIQPPTLVREGRFEGVATNLLRRYAERIHDADYREKLDEYLVTQTCPECAGTRLRRASRQVTVHGRTIIDIARLPLFEIGAWLDGLPAV
ncbi:MAG: ABC-ATPase UvrA, partial [Anaerolineales bacterium]